MANPMKHRAVVVPGSVKSSAVGGVEFVVRCCGTHEKSVHIQHPGKHSQEELLRIRDQHLVEVAQEHENHEAAIEFLAAHAKLTTETLKHAKTECSQRSTHDYSDSPDHGVNQF